MKVSKRKFNQGGFYENKTDFVLKPTDFAALGANYDQLTLKYLDAQKKAKVEQDKKAREGIRGFESRTKVMDRHNGVLQASYDIWEDARLTAISNPSAANKQSADEAYSQYSVIKENAVAITADYQKEVNDLNKGSLDQNLLGTRAQAVAEAKSFNQEIPFQVVGGRIVVPGADGEPVEYLQSTFVNEGVFGQNGRNFIASRRAPGTDFMFAPLSDTYSKQLEGDADIFNVSGDRKKGLNADYVGSRVAQRLRTDFMANPAAFVDAVSTQYGAFSYGVENLNVDNMNKATADYGGIDLYSNSKFLTDWKLVYNEKTDEKPEGYFTIAFPNVDEAVGKGGLNPQTAAAIKNRQEALSYQITNTADQTLFKLKNQYQPSPQGSTRSFGVSAKLTPTSFRRVEGPVDPGGNREVGRRLDIGGAQDAIKIGANNKNVQLNAVVYPNRKPQQDELMEPLYFEISSTEFKRQAKEIAREEASQAKQLVESLESQLNSMVGATADEKKAVREQLNEAVELQKNWTASNSAITKLPTKIEIRPGFNQAGLMFSELGDVVQEGFKDIIPTYEEIWGTMQNQYLNETTRINSALGGLNVGTQAPAAESGGVGSRYN
jgi:ElaB/YqjD/DUF883 family membrane-anchored ribosome-binding protein